MIVCQFQRKEWSIISVSLFQVRGKDCHCSCLWVIFIEQENLMNAYINLILHLLKWTLSSTTECPQYASPVLFLIFFIVQNQNSKAKSVYASLLMICSRHSSDQIEIQRWSKGDGQGFYLLKSNLTTRRLRSNSVGNKSFISIL